MFSFFFELVGERRDRERGGERESENERKRSRSRERKNKNHIFTPCFSLSLPSRATFDALSLARARSLFLTLSACPTTAATSRPPCRRGKNNQPQQQQQQQSLLPLRLPHRRSFRSRSKTPPGAAPRTLCSRLVPRTRSPSLRLSSRRHTRGDPRRRGRR